MMFAEVLGFICTAFFAGAALYVSLVEHPARMSCGPAVALTEFRPSYKRGAVMQVILALMGAGGSIAAYFLGRGIPTLIAGVILATVIPWTLIAIMPTNRKLQDETRTATTADTDVLLKKWGKLHNVRTIAAILATVILGANITGML